MALFGRKKAQGEAAALAEHLILDRCWDDMALDAGVDAVRDGHRNAGIALLRECRDDHELRAQRVRALAGASVGQSAQIKALLTENMSPAAAADLLLWLGGTLINEAWEIRGSGWASTVGDDRFKLFYSRLREARDPLVAAADLAPHDATPWVELQKYARGMQLDREQHDLAWQRAIERAPTSFPAHASRLQNLTSKWSGSHEQMFGFARDTVATAPPGSPLVAVLPMAHSEFLMKERQRFAEEGKTWAGAKMLTSYFTTELKLELIEAERTWCASAEPQPYSKEAHNLFGWAMLEAGDLERARWHLSWVGNRPGGPWDYEGAQAFAKALLRLGLTD
ncbi:MAG: hypothetical protein M3548_14310 [Actinomycetota bacterium]|nr:hypothetical protein [Actinomycetota bacterium]